MITTTTTITTTDTAIFARLADVIRDVFNLPDLEVTRETTSLDVEGWDSLSHTVLLLRVEAEFGVRLPLDRARTVATVGDLADLLAPLMTPAPATPGVDDATRWVILHGNCQMGDVGLLLQPILEPLGYKVANFANFQHHDPSMMRPTPAQAARCAVFIEQVSSMGGRSALPPIYETEFPRDCRRLRVPAFFLRSPWPLYWQDPRNVKSAEVPSGKYPYGDAHVMRLLKEYSDPDEVFRRYMDSDVNKLVDLDRLHAMTLEETVASDQLADLKFAPTIERSFRSMRLFDTVNHPSHDLVMLLRDALALFIVDGDAAVSLPSVPAPPPLTQVPVHPQVIEHFQFKWTTATSTYLYFGRPMTFEQFLRAYIAFE